MPNEPDKFFKTALDGLPDAPPPGTSFDAEALWGSLDRQLRPRRRFAGWWVAAGTALLLLAGAGWQLRFSGEKTPATTAVVGVRTDRTAVGQPERSVRTPTKEALAAAKPTGSALATVSWPRQQPRGAERGIAPPPAAPESRPEALSNPAGFSEPIPDPVAAAVVEKPVSPGKTGVPAKPRFRVVPANELLAEDEARPKLYRPEGTARVTLGFPTKTTPVAEPSPILILAKKPD